MTLEEFIGMPETDLHKRIEELESENRFLQEENKRLQAITRFCRMIPAKSSFLRSQNRVFYEILTFFIFNVEFSTKSPLFPSKICDY
jgi:hypothetical protein